ncbi:MAG: MATE family efflux transporter [Gammaproteobacteria bacterium]|jgi:MATE family multidrug resistance protein
MFCPSKNKSHKTSKKKLKTQIEITNKKTVHRNIENISYSKAFIKIITFGGYTSASMAANTANNILNAMMLANQGKEYLAASGLISVIQNMFFCAGEAALYPIALESSNLIKKKKSKKNYTKIGLIWQQGLFLSGVVLSPAPIVIAIFAKPILKSLGQSHDVSRISQEYFDGFVYGIPAAFMLFNNTQFAMGIGKPYIMFVTTLIQKGLGLGLGYFFIYGNSALHIPKLGAYGLGLANSTANWMTLTLSTLYFTFNIHNFPYYKLFNFFRREKVSKWLHSRASIMWDLIKKGALITIRVLTESLSYQFLILMAGWLGDDDLAAIEISAQFLMIITIPSFNIAHSIAVLMQNYLPQDKNGRIIEINNNAKKISFVGTVFNIVIPFIAMPFYILIPNQLISLFSIDVNDPKNEQIVFLSRNLFIINMAGLSDSIRNSLLGTLRGILDFWFITGGSVLSSAIVTIPLAYLLGFELSYGVFGLMGARNIGMLLGSMLYVIRWTQKNICLHTHVKKICKISSFCCGFFSRKKTKKAPSLLSVHKVKENDAKTSKTELTPLLSKDTLYNNTYDDDSPAKKILLTKRSTRCPCIIL